MGAKFHSLNRADYSSIGPQVKHNTNIDGFKTLYADTTVSYDDGVERSIATQHVRNVIKLSAPTFNFVLSRSGASLLATMLGIDKKTWSKVVACDLILSTNTHELVPIDEAKPDDNYLFGAEIAMYWIDKLDIEEAKLSCLYSAVASCLTSSCRVRSFIEINKTKGGMHLTCEYYAHFKQEDLSKYYKRGHNPADFHDEFIAALFPSYDTRFSYLMNMNPDKSGLYGMLNTHIVVIPEEMRPRVDKGEHKLTARYVNVLKADFEYMSIKGETANPRDVRAKYLVLNNAVSRLQYKNVDLKLASIKPDDTSILERLKSKKGQIRMNNLGKRQDYSGRAVVAINPYLPVDYIRVPKSMLPKLYEYHILPYLAENLRKNALKDEASARNLYDRLSFSNLEDRETREEMLRILNDEGILENVPVVLGRQPTLHKQSLQGFHVEPTDLQAIEVNPLVCPAFNMDFDGDQGHLEVPLSPKAVKEANDLLLTTQNILLAKTGECTIEPRQDMLYGLYMCTRDDYQLGAKDFEYVFESYSEVREWVMAHRVPVDATVKVVKGTQPTVLAGDAAVIACFAEGDVLPRDAKTGDGRLTISQITSKTISKYIDYILRTDSNGNYIYPMGTGYAKPGTFVGTINHLVELGFKVARSYSASMSLLKTYKGLSHNKIDKFFEDMEEIDFYYGLGLETSDNYQIEFDKNLKALDDRTESNIFSDIGEDSGYVLLSRSGARGSKNNLTQSFAHKGRVKKNSSESFNALLVNSYASQMTPMEHFVDAYGGRQGQIDKSLKTGDTGYAMRKMWHTTQGMSITNADCGTNEGLEVSKTFLVSLVDTPDTTGDVAEEQIKKEVQEIFEHVIVGRYRVGSNKMISRAEAKAWAQDDKVESIVIRSPIYCKNPCCRKCYGMDMSTRKLALIGLPVGIIAAQSVGEPGSQLTLKQFQKGGVSGKAEFTSAFDKVDSYIHVQDLASLSAKGTYSGYDPLAWATGKITEMPTSDIRHKAVSIEGSKKTIVVPTGTVLREYAVKGEGLSYKHGDYSIKEIVEYSGIRAAQRYLAFKLFYLYKNEVKLAMAHLEVLVSEMLRNMITTTDRPDLMVGQYCTSKELYSGDLTNTKWIPRLLSVKELPQASNEALDAIIMENQSKGLSRICLLELSDTLTKPLNRMVLGLSIVNGTNTPGFLEARKEII